MLLVARFFIIATLVFSQSAKSNNLSIFVMSDIPFTNCDAGEIAQRLYRIDHAGALVNEHGSTLLDDCKTESIWSSFAVQLISRSERNGEVYFLPITLQRSTAIDFLKDGPVRDRLLNSIEFANSKKISFKYGIIYFGVLDNKKEISSDHLNKLLKFMSLKIDVEKWLVALDVQCGADQIYLDKIAKIQREVGSRYLMRRFQGPPPGSLKIDYYNSKCDLTERGHSVIAEKWLSAILRSEKIYSSIERENLLYIFR